MDPRTNCDVAIVGGGHNGLVAACYLALDGKRCIVLEQHHKVGGMASSDALIPEAPNHIVHPCALELASIRAGTIPQDLDLARHGYVPILNDPSYVYLHDDGSSLCFFKDVGKTVAEIQKYSSKDASAYVEFVQALGALASIVGPIMRADPMQMGFKNLMNVVKAALKHKSRKDELLAFATGSAAQVVEERFEHPAVRSAIAGFAGGAGPIHLDTSSFGYLLIAILHSTGFARAKGGFQNVSNAMATRFRELGGEIRINAPVTEIIAEKQTVRGVRLESGEVITARAVIGAVHPEVAMHLVTAGEFDQQLLTRVRHAPKAAHGSSPFKIDIAMSGPAVIEPHQRERKDGINLLGPTAMFGSWETAIENFMAAGRNELPKLPYIWLTAPSVVDPTLAPEGQDILYIYPTAFPVRPIGGWPARRDESVELVMGWTRDLITNIDQLEIGRRIETADQLEERLKVPGGSYVHVDVNLLRSGSMRPAAGLSGKLPISGFFLGNAGGPGGGGVSGVPGSIAANRVKRFLK